jgi:membrane protein DedA with SNARE-associated domain
MTELRIPVPAFNWFLAFAFFVVVLGSWSFFAIGRAIGRAEAIVVYQSSEMVRSQEAIERADSAVAEYLGP